MMNAKTRTTAACAVLLAALAGCGGGGVNSPSAETRIPEVAGTYTGPITWTVDGRTIASLTARMTVAQAGSQLTISGSLTLQGQTFPMTALTGRVSATGFFTADAGAGAFNDPDCGRITPLEASLVFAGRSATYTERDSTTFCGTWTFSGTLSR